MGGNDDNSNDQSNDLIQQQINQNEAELENKRQSLYDARLAIEKSSGSLNWAPQKGSPVNPVAKPLMPPRSIGEAEAAIARKRGAASDGTI